MTTDETFFDEAMKYREIARELHEVLGANVRCTCEETPEYKEFQIERAKRQAGMSKEERLLEWIFEEDFFNGEKLISECNRCRVMFAYETAVGDEAVDMEYTNRLNKRNGVV